MGHGTRDELTHDDQTRDDRTRDDRTRDDRTRDDRTRDDQTRDELTHDELTHDGAAYFDAASAVPLHPVARQALTAAIKDGWADPGRLYAQGRRSAHLLEAARATVAETLGVTAGEVGFCPSGTDANLRGLAGLLRARWRSGRTLVHSAVEHWSVLSAAERNVSSGGGASSIPVDRFGRVDRHEFARAVAATEVAAAALMSANHEVGTLQPVQDAGRACAAAGVPLLVDASQSIGRVSVPEGWSVLTASARKWGGPAGVGLLVVRAGTRIDLEPSPAPSVPLVVAAAAALRAAAAEADREEARLRPLVDRIRTAIAASIPDVEVIGDPVARLPNMVTFSCLYVDGEALLHALDRRGFAVSSGSSCTSLALHPSHVLEAMGVLSQGNVRVSLHRETTTEQVERFLAELPGIVATLRAEAGVTGL